MQSVALQLPAPGLPKVLPEGVCDEPLPQRRRPAGVRFSIGAGVRRHVAGRKDKGRTAGTPGRTYPVPKDRGSPAQGVFIAV